MQLLQQIRHLLSIEKLSKSELQNKENFLGVHFFNPVNMMPLVEVIPCTSYIKRNYKQSI